MENNIDNFTKLVEEVHKGLVEKKGDTVYDADNIFRLVALGTSVTASLTQLSGPEKKKVLLAAVKKYIEENVADGDKLAALSVFTTFNTSLDVLFDFKNGKFNSKPKLTHRQAAVLFQSFAVVVARLFRSCGKKKLGVSDDKQINK